LGLVNGPNTFSGTPSLTLLEADGTVIESYSYGINGPSFLYEATTTGQLYIDVAGDRSGEGRYVLSASAPTDDVGETTATAAAISGTSRQVQIDHFGDRDWISFDVSAGTNFEFSAFRADGSVIRDAAGAVIWEFPENLGATIRFEQGGTYYYDVGAGPDFAGTIFLNIAETPDLPDNATTNGVITTAAPVIGQIERWQEGDWYAFDVVAGQDYQIQMDWDVITSFSSGILSVISPEGQTIVERQLLDQDSPLDVTFSADQTETVYVSYYAIRLTYNRGCVQEANPGIASISISSICSGSRNSSA
ncbi:MAG: hypothetical protein AAF353_10300, partial [Pseudomonadota bacterium]